jgi:hypothetical protein
MYIGGPPRGRGPASTSGSSGDPYPESVGGGAQHVDPDSARRILEMVAGEVPGLVVGEVIPEELGVPLFLEATT